MVAYAYRMPAGIAGATNRQEACTVEAQVLLSTNPPTAYGIGLVMDAATGQLRPPIAGDGATPVWYGLYVRPYPTFATQDPLGTNTPPTSGIANVMRRGYMTVRLMAGTAVKGAPVNIGLAAATGQDVPGGITATVVGTGIAALPNAIFMGAADSNGITEIAYNI